MAANRKAVRWCLLSILSLVAGCVAGAFFPHLLVAGVAAGFLAYVVCGRCAMAEWHADERVFTTRPRIEDHRRNPAAPRAVAVVFMFAALALPLRAQQTIFNVPSADVLDRGRVYAEVDELFRPTDPKSSATTIRGVVGVLPGVEAGVNFGGFTAPGFVVPTATVAVKIQPLRVGDFTATAGGFGLFFLRGSGDGDPAALGYGMVTYRVPSLQTRLSAGGWYASAGYVHPADRALGSSSGGALASLEQPVPGLSGLMVAADWWSGDNSIGYVSPGVVYAFGKWTAYAAYSIKNGSSSGNAGLIELGYAF
ncbi:MAG TPA: hypothetical protein VH854_11155 [Thermoanaerobaculia bacterium]|nr:hypothetical protein [Thermoanaerobaculia bacterium]